MKHTPGPWMLKSWHEPMIVTRDGDIIATVHADKNRAIVAAAPELFEALSYLVMLVEGDCNGHQEADPRSALNRGRLALSKARGES